MRLRFIEPKQLSSVLYNQTYAKNHQNHLETSSHNRRFSDFAVRTDLAAASGARVAGLFSGSFNFVHGIRVGSKTPGQNQR